MGNFAAFKTLEGRLKSTLMKEIIFGANRNGATKFKILSNEQPSKALTHKQNSFKQKYTSSEQNNQNLVGLRDCSKSFRKIVRLVIELIVSKLYLLVYPAILW